MDKIQKNAFQKIKSSQNEDEIHSLGSFAWEDKGVKYLKHIFLEGHGQIERNDRGSSVVEAGKHGE